MAFVGVFVAILAILTILIAIFRNVFGIIFAIVNHFFGDEIHIFFLRKGLAHQYKNVLQRFPYYQKLKQEHRSLFERRVQRFIDSRSFIPRQDLDRVTDEMKVMIAASAVLITFGLPRIYLRHFSRIYVSIEPYLSTHTGSYHYGEINTKGAIVLSWNRLVHGFANGKDGINLALHEMAHALKAEDNIDNKDFNFFNQSTIIKFISIARYEMLRIQEGEDSFFRKYATTNDHEFFAVAVEHFYEKTDEFYSKHPELYMLMTNLLNQDPRKLFIRQV